MNNNHPPETPRIIWIHGWAGNPLVWQKLWKHFPDSTHIFPSFAAVREPHEFVDIIIQEVKNAPCILIGWSMGATLALQAALHAPQQILGIVLFGGSARFIHKNPAIGWPESVLQRLEKQIQKDANAVLQQFTHANFCPTEHGEKQAMDYERQIFGKTPLASCGFSLAGLIAGLTLLRRTNLHPELPRLTKQPITWIHGEEDAICPPGGLREIQQKIKSDNHRFLFLPDTGHVPMWSRPEIAIEEIKRILHTTSPGDD